MMSEPISHSVKLMEGTAYCFEQEGGELLLLDDAQLGEVKNRAVGPIFF